jgi:hypothetical protein
LEELSDNGFGEGEVVITETNGRIFIGAYQDAKATKEHKTEYWLEIQPANDYQDIIHDWKPNPATERVVGLVQRRLNTFGEFLDGGPDND